MSRFSLKVYAIVILLSINLSIFVCEKDACWNASIAFPINHPVNKIALWIMRISPLSLSRLQIVAQALLVGEGVVLISCVLKLACKCMFFSFQFAVIVLAAQFYYGLSDQNLYETGRTVQLWVERVLSWIEKSPSSQ